MHQGRRRRRNAHNRTNGWDIIFTSKKSKN